MSVGIIQNNSHKFVQKVSAVSARNETFACSNKKVGKKLPKSAKELIVAVLSFLVILLCWQAVTLCGNGQSFHRNLHQRVATFNLSYLVETMHSFSIKCVRKTSG